MSKAQKINIFRRGFTIVELLIVIVIIGILATVTFVAYSGIQHSATTSTVKSTLRSATTAMKLTKVKTGSYGTSFPDNISLASGIGIALTEVSDPLTFCINATSTKFDDIQWHSTQTEEISEGLCEGNIISESILGDYNYGSQTPPSASGLAEGERYGFKVATNDSWSSITLSWDDVPNTTKYQLQTRTDNVSGAWYWRYTSTGSGNYQPGYGSNDTTTSYTSQIPGSTHSLVWPNQIPYASGQTFEYRLRPIDGGGNPGAWSTASLASPDNSNITTPKITNFTSTVDTDWSNLTLSWQEPSGIDAVPLPIYQLQTRADTTTSAWYWRWINSGSGSYSPGYGSYDTNTSFTGQIPISTTSLNWTNQIPYASGKTFEYRVRVSSSKYAGVYGEWHTIQLKAPDQSNTSTPAISQLTVTPDPSWTNLSISWSVPDNLSSIPTPIYQLQTRTDTTTSAWYWRYTSTGSGNYQPGYGSYDTNTSFTSQIPISTTSLNWTNQIPYASGKTFEYRVRVNSSKFMDAYGPWTTVQVSR